MSDLALRIADGAIAAFWAFILLRALTTGQIGPRTVPPSDRKRTPLLFFFFVFVFGLMVVHFGGLAIVGQSR